MLYQLKDSTIGTLKNNLGILTYVLPVDDAQFIEGLINHPLCERVYLNKDAYQRLCKLYTDYEHVLHNKGELP